MASEVDICNLACAHIGVKPNITAIAPRPEGSAEASYCARFYPMARDTVLEGHNWSFATRRVSLAYIDVIPPAGWKYAYAEPSNVIKVQAILSPGDPNKSAVSDRTDDFDEREYIRESVDGDIKVIYSNTKDAVIKYTIQVTDTTRYSPLFIQGVSRLLASFIAGPITKDQKIIQTQYSAYLAHIGEAKALDANAQRFNAYTDVLPAGIQVRF